MLGVLTHDTEEHAGLRLTSRRSWMLDGTILSLFVLRGRGLGARALHEARAHGDTVLLDEPSDVSYKTAPLRSLLAWLRCAHTAWPRARLIGKADDDVAVMPSRVALHLRATYAEIARQSGLRGMQAPAYLYWGMFETMHWDVETHRPTSPFRFGFGLGQPCTRRRSPVGWAWPNGTWFTNKARKLFYKAPSRNAERDRLLRAHEADAWRDRRHARPGGGGAAGLYIGPMPFAKGPLYFMARELAAQLSADRGLAADAAETIASALNTSYREPTWPWEDIYTGLALTQVATAPPPSGAAARGAAAVPLVAVHIGSDAFMESFSSGRGRPVEEHSGPARPSLALTSEAPEAAQSRACRRRRRRRKLSTAEGPPSPAQARLRAGAQGDDAAVARPRQDRGAHGRGVRLGARARLQRLVAPAALLGRDLVRRHAVAAVLGRPRLDDVRAARLLSGRAQPGRQRAASPRQRGPCQAARRRKRAESPRARSCGRGKAVRGAQSWQGRRRERPQGPGEDLKAGLA